MTATVSLCWALPPPGPSRKVLPPPDIVATVGDAAAVERETTAVTEVPRALPPPEPSRKVLPPSEPSRALPPSGPSRALPPPARKVLPPPDVVATIAANEPTRKVLPPPEPSMALPPPEPMPKPLMMQVPYLGVEDAELLPQMNETASHSYLLLNVPRQPSQERATKLSA
eukprot:CAMPEP_0203941876 /NCGR_PEP_ID=MMETSP0359-20131031/78188_1 /ASSEMBLY_ACC=CAM_ASM_000338 /TAXON_ID=268821 /ORGANISM="Scrippsiella Hangoei, Strain SHTV-5" /LENGTH=169 /DNA_ID=CAMNT_0050872513 /DNA_START=93 /DNA_END=603 /DNA_ORIENTATION=-